MYNLIRVEFFKLRKNRSFWTFLLALSVLSLAYPLLYYFDHRSNGEPQITYAEFLTTFISSNAYIIKFGVAILAGFFISNEYSTGVMKTIASSGNTRGRIVRGKTNRIRSWGHGDFARLSYCQHSRSHAAFGLRSSAGRKHYTFYTASPRANPVVHSWLRSHRGAVHRNPNRQRQNYRLLNDFLPYD